MRSACRLAALPLLFATTALAQPALPPERPPELSPAQPAPPANPPYEAKLERLAELMGTLSFMRDLCGAGDGATWRAKMTDLLASDGGTTERRDRLAGAFNRGFNGYRTTYRRCTPAATLIIDRALAEGEKLAGELSSRFGG